MLPKKTRAKVHHVKRKIYYQDLIKKPFFFKASAFCKSVDDTRAGRKQVRKTPREGAARCLGHVRLGEDGSRLYLATRVRVKNPHYRGTGSVTGSGYHYGTRWRVVYDRRTDKAFDARKHLGPILRGMLS